MALITALNHIDPYNRLSVNLGPLAIEAYLEKQGAASAFIMEDLKDLDNIDPDLVGISSVTENYGIAIEIAKEIKERLDLPLIIGGVHISSCPESLHPIFDAAVVGEGEETFLELVDSYPNIGDIPGIAYRKNGEIHVTGRRAPIADLDSLPHPNRKKWIESPGLPAIMTSRGCAYHCGFCSSPVMWGGYRDFSPRYVIDEIRDMLSSFPMRHIRLFDDTLTLNRRRLEQIVELLREEKMHEGISFSCLSRIDQLDREMIMLLLSANIKFVSVGLETASDEVLSRLKDRGAGVTRSQQVIDMAFNEGLNLSCSVIIGSPDETEKDILETFSFLSNNEKKLYEIEINPLVPHPGTAIWNYAKEKGLVNNKMDWSRLKDYSNLLLFDPDKYIYLNEQIPYEKFLTFVKGFKALFRRGLKADAAHFGDIVYPAKVRRISEFGNRKIELI